MKTQKLSISNRNKFAKNANKRPDLDVLKWIALMMTFIGIVAWTAGFSYDQGYWGVIGWEYSLNRRSPQETALVGFIGPVLNWFYAGFLISGIGIYIFLMGFLSGIPNKTNKKMPAWALKIENWLKSRKKFGPTMKLLCVGLLVGGIGFAVLIVLPAAGWMLAAYSEGKMQMQDQICEVRNATSLPTTVWIDAGTNLSGRMLNRTKKASMLLDKKAVHVIAAGDRPRILDSTDVTGIKCIGSKAAREERKQAK